MCAISYGVSNAQESPFPAEEQSPISPDKKWAYIGGDAPKLVKVVTSETEIDFFEQRNPGTAPAGEDSGIALGAGFETVWLQLQSDARASYDVSVDRFLSATWR